MYEDTKFKVLEVIYLNEGIHKREISKRLGLSMPSIDNALRKIEKILKKQKSGNQIKYFLNYSNPALTPLLSVVEYKRSEKLSQKIRYAVRDFLNELEIKPLLAIIFGSYAVGNYTKNSDVDIFLVFQKITDSKKIENLAKKISLRMGVNVNPVYLDYVSFLSSFHDSTKEFFKRLKKDKIVLTGIELWRQLKNEEA